jgi:bacterioferritin-associated ferredoxin
MYVCICKGITDKQIRAAVAAGASSLPELQHQLGVSSQCGKCQTLACQVMLEAMPSSEAGYASYYAA